MMMGAYNGAGSVIHWMTPPPLTFHLKHFGVRNLNFLPSKFWPPGMSIWCKLYNS